MTAIAATTGRPDGKPPYLSVVMTCRNDNHGGDMVRRMEVSIGGIITQLERFGVDSEVIIVEWNPTVGKSHAVDELLWPSDGGATTVRQLVVAPEIHRRFPYHDRRAIHTTAAINAGIRRARGQFVLPGTLDALYSDEIMALIASRQLETDVLYRADRRDVDRRVLELSGFDEQMAFADDHVLRVHRRRRHFHRHLPDLHTNACGDFQLTARENFVRLRGYRQWEIVSAHNDSTLAFAAYAAGIREEVLGPSHRLYHIDHADGFHARLRRRPPPWLRWLEWLPLPNKQRNRVIGAVGRGLGIRITSELAGVPTLDWHDGGLDLCRDMIAGRRPYTLNDENWGLANETLPERCLARASWEAQLQAERNA